MEAEGNSLVYLYSTSNNAFSEGIFTFTEVSRIEILVAKGKDAFQRGDANIYHLGKGGIKISSTSSNRNDLYNFRYSNIAMYGGGGNNAPIDLEMSSRHSFRDCFIRFRRIQLGNVSFRCAGETSCAYSTFEFREIQVLFFPSFFLILN